MALPKEALEREQAAVTRRSLIASFAESFAEQQLFLFAPCQRHVAQTQQLLRIEIDGLLTRDDSFDDLRR